MTSWAAHRKWAYIGAFLFVVIVIANAVYFIYFYRSPTCFDGTQNGTETGVDCGGSCVRLCPRENIDPIIHWSRAFQISTSTFSLLAYVENPNINAGVSDIAYTFKVFDAGGRLLVTKTGQTFIPPAKIFGIFEGPITIASATPKTVTFEFGASAPWQKAERTDTVLKATRIRLTRERPTPRVDASLQNSSLSDIRNIEAIAVIYDDEGNAFAVSRTLVDRVSKESSQDVVFTWPKAFIERFATCELPSDIALVIDRSGSMASDGNDPPEPLTTIKKAVASFVSVLGKNARVSVISFATNATEDQSLTSSGGVAEKALEQIIIKTDGTQQTNIGDALAMAVKSLELTASSSQGVHRAVVLLTDGVPTEPTKAKDDEYPKKYAIDKALQLVGNGIDLYAIGLGKNIDETFLRSIVSNTSFFYKAPTAADVPAIYGRIAESFCKKNPVIEVIPRIYPSY